MSPIEAKLYEAMCREDLSPVPQFRIEDYIADFAFPDVKIAIEADGAAFHTGERRERDRKRDWRLRTQVGWTVMRFYGSTIHNKAGNCAYVIKRDVTSRRKVEQERERQRD
jgi:very-short-patch-repair endonuclease